MSSHYSLPALPYDEIAAVRLSTRSALNVSVPSAPNIPEPPRPQYDAMKAYERLEKSGTIAKLESLQQNIRPLFAYPKKAFETPRKKKVQRDEDLKPLFEEEAEEISDLIDSSDLVNTSDMLDSIFSASPAREKGFSSSSPPMSMDFSSSHPYPAEQGVWRSSPPIRNPGRKSRASSSRPMEDFASSPPEPYLMPSSNDLPYPPNLKAWRNRPSTRFSGRTSTTRQLPDLPSSPPKPSSSNHPYSPEQEVWRSSPPLRNPERRTQANQSSPELLFPPNSSLHHPPRQQDIWQSSPPLPFKIPARPKNPLRRISSNSSLLRYLPASSPPDHGSRGSRSNNTTFRKSAPQWHRTVSRTSEEDLVFKSQDIEDSMPMLQKKSNKTRSQRRSGGLVPSTPAVMRYVTDLEDIFEDEHASIMEEEMKEDPRAGSRRSRLGVRVGKALGWVLGR